MTTQIFEENKNAQPNWALLSLIRFFLAIVVFNDHMRLVEGNPVLGEWFLKGAVASFFVISGFSMAHSLSRGTEGFYERRFYRVWPLYILSIALALVPLLRGGGFYVWPGGGMVELPERAQLILNAVMLQPMLTTSLGTNMVIWSLGIEAVFYVVVPFYAKLNERARLTILVSSLVFGIWANHISPILLEGRGGLWAYLGYFWLFAMGFELFYRRHNPRAQQGALAAAMLGGIGSITMAVSLLLVLHQSKIQIAPKWQKIFLYLGELSYPIYILHDPVMAIINQAAPATPTFIYYIVGFVVSAFAYHLIDAPLRRWHRARQSGNASRTAVMASVPAP